MSDQWGDEREQDARAEQVEGVEAVEPLAHAELGWRTRSKRVAVAAIVAGLLGGLAVGLTLGAPGVAHSQSAATPPSSSSTNTKTNARDQYLQSALAPLVKNGTITQAQADAVVKQLDTATKARVGGFVKLRGVGDVFSAAAKKIGVTEDALKTALRNGQSIADVAKSKHVDPNAVVDAMVAAAKTDLDQAVKNNKISSSAEQTQLTKLKTMFTTIVNATTPQGFGFGFRFGHGFKGHGVNPGGNSSENKSGSTSTTGNNAGFSGGPFSSNTI